MDNAYILQKIVFVLRLSASVAITTTAGEQKAATSKNEVYINKIINSINDAIVSSHEH